MNVRDFEYVLEIAKQNSITKAANRLYISQPSLSKFLQKMEEELGTPLFYRMGKQFSLTPAGKCYVEKAQSIVNLKEQIADDIHNLVNHKHGEIHLGAPYSRGEFIISMVLPKFQEQFPHIKVLIDFNSTASLLKKLEQGEQDILFINYSEEKPHLHYDLIGEEEMVLAVPADSPIITMAKQQENRNFPFIENRYWMNEPFVIAGENLKSGRYARDYFKQFDISPPITLEIMTVNLILLAVRMGLGIALVPSIPYNTGNVEQTHRYLCTEDENAIMRIAVVSQKGRDLSYPEKTLVQIIKECHNRKIE
ncbi:LysR family transcriptional regulator [Clostridium merdae]|uniref:LysR family transcriptional regulator n=1 Tax=Clostridium merdae TaxID=1958780 RepID=UPI000A267033|nr:LysR family transcriptional regulator [Clostridium merdae]